MEPAPNPQPPPATSAAPSAAAVSTDEQLKDALKEVYDPEIPINILDLGLIYKLESKDGKVAVEMTLTSPMCPVGDQLKAQVAEICKKQPGVQDVAVNLVYDPPWTKEKMSFDGKLQAAMLGI